MEQDFLESHVQTENAVSSVEETHEVCLSHVSQRSGSELAQSFFVWFEV